VAWRGGVCAVLVDVLRMTAAVTPPSGRQPGLLRGRRGLQARKSRSGGRPSSEVSRAGTDGVRIRPWAGP
jgi:hypothetical protein